MTLEARLDDGDDRARPSAAGQGGRLEAVVAEILDAADAGAGRHIHHRPTGEDRDVQTIPVPRSEPGQSPKGALGARIDRRGAWVTRTDGQGPVEVGDHEETAGRRGESIERDGDLGTARDRIGHGWSTPGRIAATGATLGGGVDGAALVAGPGLGLELGLGLGVGLGSGVGLAVATGLWRRLDGHRRGRYRRCRGRSGQQDPPDGHARDGHAEEQPDDDRET